MQGLLCHSPFEKAKLLKFLKIVVKIILSFVNEEGGHLLIRSIDPICYALLSTLIRQSGVSVGW